MHDHVFFDAERSRERFELLAEDWLGVADNAVEEIAQARALEQSGERLNHKVIPFVRMHIADGDHLHRPRFPIRQRLTRTLEPRFSKPVVKDLGAFRFHAGATDYEIAQVIAREPHAV